MAEPNSLESGAVLSQWRSTPLRAAALREQARALAAERMAAVARSHAAVERSERLLDDLSRIQASLSSCIQSCSRELRTLGTPSETTVIRVKEIVDEVAPLANPDDIKALRESLVRWSIDAYFAA